MRRLACLLLVVAVLCPLNFVAGEVNDDASTVFQDSDYTWTAGSYHKLSSTLVIPAGVTLTIEPGVWVDLWDCRINVYGAINASGTSDNRIMITSSINRNLGLYANSIQPDGLWFSPDSSGKIQNTRIEDRMDISGSINVANSTLQGFVEVDNGSSAFTQNTI